MSLKMEVTESWIQDEVLTEQNLGGKTLTVEYSVVDVDDDTIYLESFFFIMIDVSS